MGNFMVACQAEIPQREGDEALGFWLHVSGLQTDAKGLGKTAQTVRQIFNFIDD